MAAIELIIWHLRFYLFYAVPSLALFVLILRRLWIKEFIRPGGREQKFILEKPLSKSQYYLVTLIMGIAFPIAGFVVSGKAVGIFPMLVIPAGLVILQKMFYFHRELIDSYSPISQDVDNLYPSPRPGVDRDVLLKRKRERWNELLAYDKFHFNHPILLLFVGLLFVIPASYFDFQEHHSPAAAFLIGVEYYFIGMATWTCGLGTWILYLLSHNFIPRIAWRMHDSQIKLIRASNWTILGIALIPGIGLPAYSISM